MNLAEEHIICRQLREVAVGKTIKKAVVNQNPHTFVWFALEAGQMYSSKEINNTIAPGYEPLLTGKKIRDAAVIGGMGYIFIDNRAMSIGILPKYHEKGEKLPKRHQLLLVFDDDTALSFTGLLGGALFFMEEGHGGWWAREGSVPTAMDERFTREYFLKLIGETELRSLSAKAFLATKNRIPGLDNTILHEILWEAEVNPKSKMAALSQEEYVRMHQAIEKVFPAVIAAGGLDTQKDVLGNFGNYRTKVSRNTLGQPCPRCGSLIEKESYLGGAVYYCPGCQPVRQ